MSKYRVDRNNGEVYEVDHDMLVFKRATLYIVAFEVLLNAFLIGGVLYYGYEAEQNAIFILETFFALPIDEQNRLLLYVIIAEVILLCIVSLVTIVVLQKKKSEIVDDWK